MKIRRKDQKFGSSTQRHGGDTRDRLNTLGSGFMWNWSGPVELERDVFEDLYS